MASVNLTLLAVWMLRGQDDASLGYLALEVTCSHVWIYLEHLDYVQKTPEDSV